MSRVLLISPPWMTPSQTSIALATLRPILAAEGIAADELHGSLLFPRVTALPFMSGFAAHFFAPLIDESLTEPSLEALIERFADEVNQYGLLLPGRPSLDELGRDEAAVRRDFPELVAKADLCLSRCMQVAGADHYDVVLFSVTFESQLPAALALAKRIHAARPDARIAFGGPACFGSAADALVEGMAALSAVCHCEGDDVVVPLVRALRGEQPLDEVPGIAFVRDGELVRTPAPPLLRDMNRLPVPDYGPWVQQHAQSEWRDVSPLFFMEASRGCWWGQHTTCVFCGLNAEGMLFRSKTPERVVDEVSHFYTHYPWLDDLHLTDNILDKQLWKAAIPRIAEVTADRSREWHMFAEVRSDLTYAELVALRDARIDELQPGIESLHDGVLKEMAKGAAGLRQVQFMKWAAELDIVLAWNLLIGNPGEKAQWYDEMTELVDHVDHLPPPGHIGVTKLERFSPYHTDPGRFGMTNLRPAQFYEGLFPASFDLQRLAYMFDYDHDMWQDERLATALRRFTWRALTWQQHWQPGLLTWREEGDVVWVTDRRADGAGEVKLVDNAARLYRFLDEVRTRKAVGKELEGVDVDAILAALKQHRLVATDSKDRWLAVAVRANAERGD